MHTLSNRRGVIQSADRSFADLSGHDPASIVGAHHRVVRHPDMPRAVFARTWQLLHGGGLAAAYVKNLSADGRFFWVFSVVVPVAGGHVNVRRAPRGPLFAEVAEAYRRLRAAERQGEGLAAQLARLDGELADLGFADFRSFMARAMQTEVADLPDTDDARDWRGRMTGVRARLAALQDARERLADSVMTMRLLPTNMRIIASRLEPSGGPISAISQRYKADAAELLGQLAGGGEPRPGSVRPVIAQLDELMIHDAATRLLRAAAAEVTRNELVGLVTGAEVAALMQAYGDLPPPPGTLSPDELQQRVRKVRHEAEAVIRLMKGLEQVRILGEVESSRLRGADLGLSAVMAQMQEFHTRVRDGIAPMISLLRQFETAS